MPKECRRDGCEFECYTQLGMEYHLIRDHEPLKRGVVR